MTNYLLKENLFNEIEIPPNGILSHTIHNDAHTKAILFGFAPGQELTAHTAPMPAIIQVLKGEASLTLGTDVCEVGAGCMIHMAPQLMHGIVAKTPLLMLLILVKAAREDKAPQAV